MIARRFLFGVAVTTLVCSALCCVAPAQESPQTSHTLVGRMGLLRDVHGYDAEGTALVPVRGLCEWLGADVTYADGRAVVTLGGTRLEVWPGLATVFVNGALVQLQESARDFSGIVCAPVAPLCKALGAKVRYVPGCYAGEVPEGADGKWNMIPHVIITQGQRECTILIHQEHPDVVAHVIADLEHTTQVDSADEWSQKLGDYGVDWILGVARSGGDGRFFFSSVPAVWAEPGDPNWPSDLLPAFCSGAWGLYGKVDGKWRLLEIGQDKGVSHRIVVQYGIPKALLDQWGLKDDSGT